MKKEHRTLKRIVHKLVDNPFLPMLFISEAIKTAAVAFTALQPVVIYAILAVVFTAIWVLSDSIDIEEGTIIGE